jgi:hypothetical protein
MRHLRNDACFLKYNLFDLHGVFRQTLILMKKLFLSGAALAFSLAAQAQIFTLPTAVERFGPAVSSVTLPSSSYNFTSAVNQVSNADYLSVLAGQTIKIAGWSDGASGGMVWGYDDASGLPLMSGAQMIGGIDVQVGIMENIPIGGLYAVVGF